MSERGHFGALVVLYCCFYVLVAVCRCESASCCQVWLRVVVVVVVCALCGASHSLWQAEKDHRAHIHVQTTRQNKIELGIGSTTEFSGW